MRAARVLGPPLGLAAAVGLAGCFTVPPPSARPVLAPPPPSAPPPTVPQGASASTPDGVPDAVPRVEPRSRYGNPPFYDVFGRRYYVQASASGYVERGVASWYGPGFHKIRTSSGEPYDMYGMTAAHRTLPLPAYVRVTNLQNGRSVVVRVNDRGPFVGNRIIDLSYSAAYRLDMLQGGTALVEVRNVDPVLPLDAAAGAASPAAVDPGVAHTSIAPQGAASASATVLPPSRAPANAPPMPRGASPLTVEAIPQDGSAEAGPARNQGSSADRTPAVPPSAAAAAALNLMQGAAAALSAPAAAAETAPQRALFVQAGAFTDPANAERLATKLQSGGYGKIFVRDDVVAGRRMYRVRIGPVPDVPEFDRIVAALDQAGVHDARLAFD